MLVPFNFKQFGDWILITNDLGNYDYLTEEEFFRYANQKCIPGTELYERLVDKRFMFDTSLERFLENIKPELRAGKGYLFAATSLHIFVVTNYCNAECVYCQAQSGNRNACKRMTVDTAEKSVDIALQSPQKDLAFEFQGGEPLSNFSIIRHIIEYTEKCKGDKNINYSIVTNLSLLTEDILLFLKKYSVSISTSLDGNELVHNSNRPLAGGKASFALVKKKMENVKTHGLQLGAIQTTTRVSLKHYREIIDTYVDCRLSSIFLRPLTPLGFAAKQWDSIGYTIDEFIEFYKKSLEYIVELNKSGVGIVEGHAAIFLSKILRGIGTNYMELRSPCGASVGQMAYYYDGNIFTCDEGRMLYEMGDASFRLGDVFEDDYDSLMESTICKTVCKYSVIESLPGCTDCVYQPYCGTCPVVNYALEKDIISKTRKNYRCTIYKGMLDVIFKMLMEEENKEIFWKWVN